MRSVSMLAPGIGMAGERRFLKGSMSVHRLQLPDIGQVSGNRCRRGHTGAQQMRAGAATLASDEVAVRGRGAALSGSDCFAIRAEAQRASCLAPLEARRLEDGGK